MSKIGSEALFQEVHGSERSGFAAIHSPVHYSPGGIPYLLSPGVVVIARPQVNVGELSGFLDGFDTSLHFSEYVNDPTTLPDGAQVSDTPAGFRQGVLGSARGLAHPSGNGEVEAPFPQAFHETRSWVSLCPRVPCAFAKMLSAAL